MHIPTDCWYLYQYIQIDMNYKMSIVLNFSLTFNYQLWADVNNTFYAEYRKGTIIKLEPIIKLLYNFLTHLLKIATNNRTLETNMLPV